LLRSSDFRRVYEHGAKFSGPLFTAFLLKKADADGSRVGFTLPRALGKAVRRNRIRRRLREAVRLELARLAPEWDIVINPRRGLLDASWDNIRREVERLMSRCENS